MSLTRYTEIKRVRVNDYPTIFFLVLYSTIFYYIQNCLAIPKNICFLKLCLDGLKNVRQN